MSGEHGANALSPIATSESSNVTLLLGDIPGTRVALTSLSRWIIYCDLLAIRIGDNIFR
jgi:hypothetical protein